ncbi:alanine:cation symporter family protein [Exilibacterium tricleocarpae]|uniref:Alanine:cation symporter family protein n=1 Tax=Exilibacterium tricleocarpae TaxID=2591008 RepID=A0A545TFR0_9GAMM|nr:amino acid carrier protein [Exilibacterium tricleocarpae]TQV76035.1 alanine:cation symporter family protein [Exilibacterium tricleocarpae]
MTTIDQFLQDFNNFVWGPPLLLLLLGGGLFFALYSRFTPYRHFGHALAIVRGKFDDPNAAGELTHAQALSAALAGTIGLGNIAGVALAITAGGPGAVFWMWMTALLGVATKFFTCTLGVMYRGRDSLGRLQGGPMYIVREGLGKRFYPLAVLFAVAGLFGVLPVFQANQLVEALRQEFFDDAASLAAWQFNLVAGIALAAVVAGVIFGGLPRLAKVAVRVVPGIAVLYLLMTVWVLARHAGEVPAMLGNIVTEAFSGSAVGGGLLGVMVIGISRGAFSNEAGIGTEVMAHGAAKTDEPVREGLVAMLGPVVDTLLICTCTALVILITGVWQEAAGLQGVTLTINAYRQEMGLPGVFLLGLLILSLGLTTMFTYWYYGAKCLGFLIGAEYQHYYKYFHVLMVVVGSGASVGAASNLLSGMYALMAIPTMTASLLLAPRVMAASRDYFARCGAWRAESTDT